MRVLFQGRVGTAAGVRFARVGARAPCALPVDFVPSDVQATDVATIVCTSTDGVISCLDENGKEVQGKQFQAIQSLLIEDMQDAPELKGNKGKPEVKTLGDIPSEKTEPVAVAAPSSTASISTDNAGEPIACPSSQCGAAPPKPVSGSQVAPGQEPQAAPAPSAAPQLNVAVPAERLAQDPAPSEPSGNTQPASPSIRKSMQQNAGPGQRPAPRTVSTPGNQDPSKIATLSSPDSALFPGNELSPGASASPKPAVKAAASKAGLFPGNIDPEEPLMTDWLFGDVPVGIKPATGGKDGTARKVSLVNDKGLIPGNVPPEVGDIVQLLEAVNSRPVTVLSAKLFPGNVPPESQGGPTPVELEISPANGGGNQPTKALTMELVPGNIPPEVEGMLNYLQMGNLSSARV